MSQIEFHTWVGTPERLTREVRRRQMVNIGLEIARESGFIGLTCYTLADRIGCHHNLVRRYMGRRTELCTTVAIAAQALGEIPIIRDARKSGFIT